MYELKVHVTKVMGTCTADPPMKPGDFFSVRDGDIRIPAGGYVCLWALHSLMPMLPAKERETAEAQDEDWMWRVHHAQCPDPEGRVIWKIERVGKVGNSGADHRADGDLGIREWGNSEEGSRDADQGSAPIAPAGTEQEGELRSLRVVVQEVRGKCTSGMRPGDSFLLHSGRLYIPAERHFCLYALQAVLPMLPAKQRPLAEGDWLKGADQVICPDPAGNVIMRIERL
jgi:uncharacterized repeat protein (TIGR04076 family)